LENKRKSLSNSKKGEVFLSPKMIKPVQLTKEGLEALKVELDELVNVKRPKLVERLSYARQEGDLNENSDYANAKEEMEFLDGRIAELEYVTKNAVTTNGNGKKNGVDVGTKVTVKTGGGKITFDIVGEWEADPVNKKISPESPLGKALYGKKIGEKVDVEAPAGNLTYEILAID
jgi:transcription elongation factor GreA